MKYRVLPPVMMMCCLIGASGSQVMAQSEALKDAQAAASQVDLSRYLRSSSDARSQSFFFGGLQQHPFTVDSPGRYRFTSSTLPGDSQDYKITATLVDGSGNPMASGTGFGNSGGLAMEESLEPGQYTLQVSGHKFGTSGTGGSSYNITVAELDASGSVVVSEEGGVDNGGGIMFGGPSPSGRTTAFVDDSDQVATLNAPGRNSEAPAPGDAPQPPSDGVSHGSTNTGTTAVPPATQSTPSASDRPVLGEIVSGARSEPVMPSGFDEIVSDIKVLQEGEVMSFDVADAGTVSVTSSTFPGNEGTYRLEARILDENGRTVASDEGSLAVGDFDIETVLQPGRYRVWVKGQRYGSAMSAANNYTLRVQQLDMQ